MWVAIVSAAAALAGVAFGEYRAGLRQRQLMKAQNLREQRELIVDVLVIGQRWIAAQGVVVVALGRMSWDDLAEFADTDSGRDLRDLSQRLAIALTRARLFVIDPACRSRLVSISTFVDTYATTVNDQLLRTKGSADAVAAGISHHNTFHDALVELEQAAIELR